MERAVDDTSKAACIQAPLDPTSWDYIRCGDSSPALNSTHPIPLLDVVVRTATQNLRAPVPLSKLPPNPASGEYFHDSAYAQPARRRQLQHISSLAGADTVGRSHSPHLHNSAVGA